MKFIHQESVVSLDHPYLIALQEILNNGSDPTTKFKYCIGEYYLQHLRYMFRYTNCIMLSGYKHMAVVEKVSCRTGVSFLKVYQFGKNGFITTVTIKTTDLQKIFVNPYSDKLLINGYMGIKWQN